MNSFERFKFVDTDNTFHNTIFATLNGALFTYQIFFPCNLHREVSTCVRVGNSSKSRFLHQRDFELRDSHGNPSFFTSLSIKLERIFAFFCFSCKNFSLLVSRKNLGRLTRIQTSTVAQFSVQVIFYTKLLPLWVFVLFLEDAMSIPKHSYHYKHATPRKDFYLPAQNLVQCRT